MLVCDFAPKDAAVQSQIERGSARHAAKSKTWKYGTQPGQFLQIVGLRLVPSSPLKKSEEGRNFSTINVLADERCRNKKRPGKPGRFAAVKLIGRAQEPFGLISV
jgi:hypothetical protein